MGELVAFPLENGGAVIVELHRATAGDGAVVTRGLSGKEVTAQAGRTFEDAVQHVEPAAKAIVDRLRGMTERPDEIHVEFGLDLHAEVGAFVAAASATANFKIALTWRRS